MPVQRGLRLLSLDGDGTQGLYELHYLHRGLSQLYILQEIVEQLKFVNKMDTLPRPCDVFDMIAGSGTGGLIAILLGRLRMSVDEAIQAYGHVADAIHTTSILETPASRAVLLEHSLRKIMEMKTGESECLMSSDETFKCKTFVCAMPAKVDSPGMARLFRTFETVGTQEYNCTAWEAACATAASPQLLGPVSIGSSGMEETFIDGSLGCSNPLDALFQEASIVFPGRMVSCVVSLGAGRFGHTTTLNEDIARLLTTIANDCERTANDIEMRFRNVPDVYFRFNLTQPVVAGDQALAAAIKADTSSYLLSDEVKQKITRAVQALASRDAGEVSTRQLCTHVPGYGSRRNTHAFPASNQVITKPSIAETISIFSSSLDHASYFGQLDIHVLKLSKSKRKLKLGEKARYFLSLGTINLLNKQQRMAESLIKQNRFEDAERVLFDVYAGRINILGERHEESLLTRHTLGYTIERQGRWIEAEIIYREVLEMRKAVLGLEHIDTLTTQIRFNKVVALQRRQEGVDERQLEPETEQPMLPEDRRSLAVAMSERGEHGKALQMLEEVLAEEKHLWGETNPETLKTRFYLAGSHWRQGNRVGAKDMYTELLEVQTSVLGSGHDDTLATKRELALISLADGKPSEAWETIVELLVEYDRGDRILP